MSTPISNLPLKTAPPQDQSEIEDPLIQNVLKEFEDDMKQPKEVQQQSYQQPVHIMPQQQYQTQPHYQPQYQPTEHKKLIDINLVKKTVIIAIIVFLLQNYNIVNVLMQKFPETVTKHISGKEFILNFLLICGIFYTLMFYGIL